MGVVYNNAFGDWLRELMQQQGLVSSRQVEKRTGVSHSTIVSVLGGKNPTLECALRIAMGFNVSISHALRLAGYSHIADAWEAQSLLPTQTPEDP